MDVDDPIRGFTQKGLHRLFEQRIPIENGMVGGVHCTETDIAIGMDPLKPDGAIPWKGTFNDMRDRTLSDEAWG